MAPPLSTQRPKPHDILGTLKARKKACGLVKGLVHLRKRLHDHTVNSRPPLKHEMGVCCTIWISEYNLDGSWWWERKSAHQGNPPKEKLYLCSLPRMVFWERKSAHQGSPLKEKPLPLDRDRPPESEALFVWSLHGWFSEKGSQHIKAVHSVFLEWTADFCWFIRFS